MKKTLLLFALLALVNLVSAQEGEKPAASVPKNIIVFISDGWGYNHVAATNYFNGVESTSYQNFSTKLPMSTYCTATSGMWDDELSDYGNSYNSYLAWTDWTWMKRENDGGDGATGSGAAATTMASGKKANKYAIGMDNDSVALELISERAIQLGKLAGVVSSVQFAHATPAGFSAHNGYRSDYVNIALNQILDSKLNVIMGCGNPEYNNDGESKVPSEEKDYKYVGGSAAWTSLKAGDTDFTVAAPSGRTRVQDITGDGNPDAWSLIQDSADFQNLIYAETVPTRVLGVPKVNSTLQHSRSGDYRDVLPFSVPYTENVPRLHQMTNAALNVLDKNDSEDEGFFLMVEGGAVDWAGHGNSLTRIIEEQTDFNNAVDSALVWLERNGELENTLVIVTGDHETGYLVGDNFDIDNLDMVSQYPVIDNGEGVMPGGKFMSNEVKGAGTNSGEHTNQLIPFFAQGPGADKFNELADQEDFVRGRYIDNTDMAHTMFDLWPVDNKPEPKNVILMVSDGWSYNHIKSAEFHRGTPAAYWDFPEQFYMSTYPAMTGKVWENDNVEKYNTWYNSADAWTDENYINTGYTGSAPAATAMYCGVKTSKYAIGVDIDGDELLTFGERGFEAGKSVGVVSSVQFAHATPASMLAHNTSRNNYAEIANEMLIDSRATVIFGAGAPDYDDDGQSKVASEYKYVGGEGTWNNLLEGNVTVFDSTTINGNNTIQDIDGDGNPDPWTLIRDNVDVLALATGPTPLRVVCLPRVGSTLNKNRTTGDANVAYSSPLNSNVPTLVDMTKAALNVLDNNERGFSLMIEGGAVDWAGHANQIGRIIEEQQDFDNSVNAVIDWVEANSSWDETLLIVTGDHETGYLVGPNFNANDMQNTWAVTDKGAGKEPGYQFKSGGHTNQLIPIFFKGEGAEIFNDYADHDDYVVGEYMDNTEIAIGVFKMWENLPNANPSITLDDIITSVENEMTESGVAVYPTVTSGLINVNIEQAPALYKVYDFSGSTVKMGTIKSNNETIDLSNQADGVYIVSIQTGNNKISNIKITKK